MTNYKITVSYDGTRYNGWQRQGNTNNTIQEKLENVISIMCNKKNEVFSSGRTDAGVHAFKQTVNFKCDTDMSTTEIMEYLNRYLPEDILIKDITIVDERFHSRLNAISKTYCYSITYQKPDVFMRKYVYYTDEVADIELMKEASKKLVGTHDFLGFSSLGKSKKSTVRTVNFIDISDDDGIIRIRINADGFLYNMVRIICGTLYDIGCGKISPDVIDEVFKSKVRSDAGVTFPAKGLMLMEVIY